MLNDLDKAKFELLTTAGSAFIANVLLNLNIEEDESIRTACVDGVTIKIAPSMWNSFSLKEKLFVLAHEAWHVAYGHTCMNTDGLDMATLFKAADYTINNMLKQAGYSMPDWVLMDLAWKDLSTKEIYDILLKDKNSPESPDTFTQAKSKTDVQAIKQKVDKIVVQASIAAEKANEAGTVPSEVARTIKDLINPKLPWYRIVARFLNQFDKSDYSYTRPNRRYLPMYLPSLLSNKKLVDVAIATDASGSVADEDYTVFFSEIFAILKKLKPKKITLLPFTTKIEEEIVLKKPSDVFKIESNGYGGTDITPVLEWAIKNKPKLLIVFSDMEFWFPEGLVPQCPVIWIHKSTYDTHPDITVPFGKLIYYDNKET